MVGTLLAGFFIGGIIGTLSAGVLASVGAFEDVAVNDVAGIGAITGILQGVVWTLYLGYGYKCEHEQ